jgi:hypothetical protein
MTVTESENARPPIYISAPAELVEATRYLLGFAPVESIVLIGYGCDNAALERRRVRLSARVDLDTPEEQLDQLVSPLQRGDVAAVTVLFFTADPIGKGLRQLSYTLTDLFLAAGIELTDVLVATDTHWWSMLCENPQCCPVGGTPRLAASQAAAEMVFAGIPAAATREELAERFEQEPDLDRYTNALLDAEYRKTKAVLNNRLKDVLKRDLALIIAEIRRHREDPDRRLTVPQVGRIGVALQDYMVRDEIWLGIDDHTIEADDLLLQLVRRLPAPYQASPLFLYGWAAWRAGNGALASIAVERAMQAEPNYSAARLLQVALQNGVDPRTMPALREPE